MNAKQEISRNHRLQGGLASIIPKKPEPSMMYGWRASLASLLFKQVN